MVPARTPWAWLQNVMSPAAGPPESATCVYVSGNAVALSRLVSGRPSAMQLRADPIDELTQICPRLAEQLSSLADGSHLGPVNLVLAPELYALNLLERPEVPDDELRDAARWRVQEHIDFAADEAVVDTFSLPRGAARDRELIFVVAAQQDLVRSIVSEVAAAGLQLASIDITALALRNLVWNSFPMADQSVALLRLSASSGLINLSRAENLYLSRRIAGVPADMSAPAWQDFRERLLVQVQRSIDYYESTMGQPTCNLLMVACTHDWTEEVTSYLSECLTIPVRAIGEVLAGELSLELHNPNAEVIDWNALDPRQVNAVTAGLPALGGVLRQRLNAHGVAG